MGLVADGLLAAVGLERRTGEPARRLSGGEMQRTAIARALLLGPALLLADEPTGNLDARGAQVVADLLFRLVRERGAALVLATHDLELAARATTRLRLRGGRLSADGAAKPAASP